MADEDLLQFSSGEGEKRCNRRLKKSQVTAERLSYMYMFELDVVGIHLVEEFSGATEWPTRDGRFDLSEFGRDSSLRVEGRRRANAFSTSPAAGSSQPMGSSYSPLFRSVLSSGKKASSYSLKVTLAERNGNKITNATRQCYIALNENTATFEYITAQMREEFGDNNLILATANGLPVEDAEVTRGLVFWRASSRNVFAVPPFRKKKRTSSEVTSLDDEGEDSNSASKPAVNSDIKLQDIKETVNTAVVEAIKKELNTNFFIARAVQNYLIKEFMECFECVICKETTKPPVMVSSCCESVLGCEGCVNTWISSGNSTCPKCRSEDDFIAINLKGFQILTRLNSSFTRIG